MITQQELKKWLRYYPDSGDFIWLRGVRVGRLAGYRSNFGYLITILGKTYTARRLAWLYMTGEFPPEGQAVYSISQNPFSAKWSDLSITPAGCREMTDCKINHAKREDHTRIIPQELKESHYIGQLGCIAQQFSLTRSSTHLVTTRQLKRRRLLQYPDARDCHI